MRMMRLIPSVFCLSLVTSGFADSPINSDLESDSGEVTIMLPGEVPLVLVRIPAGTFVMGSPEDERGYLERDGPLTTVTLTEDFYMGKYQVTQAQWAAVMGQEWQNLGFPGQPDNPVENVTWNDAQDFIAALNDHNSSSGQEGIVVRLPTEAEWEYSARAGTTTRFYFGDSLIDLGGDSNGDWCEDDGLRTANMWYCGNNGANSSSPDWGTKPVGQKLPNAFGLYDMHGNVWEWCQDWFVPSLPGGSVTDPTGPESAALRVRRGGSWGSIAEVTRSAARLSQSPSTTTNDIGFRLAATIDFPQPSADKWVVH